MNAIDNIVEEISMQIAKAKPKAVFTSIGQVAEVKDEVVFLAGFDNVSYGELVEFKGQIPGLIIDLQEELAGVIVFGDFLSIKEGDQARATGEIFTIPVGDNYIGRVIDGLASPIDGAGSVRSNVKYPVERVASGVITRYPVDTPLQTGIKIIDAVIPIGRGQRELIIGDRGTGKTT